MKKNLATRLGIAALAFTLITASLVSGTYSKYTKEVTGSDTARVARFAFSMKDDEGVELSQADASKSFNIFDYAAVDSGVLGSGIVGTEKIIAPGTTGTITFTVENKSEVLVSSTFVLSELIGTVNNTTIPIYYTLGANSQRYSSVLDEKDYTGGTYLGLDDLQTNMSKVLNANNGTVGAESKAEYILNWAWAYEGGHTEASQTDQDINDTVLGISAPIITLNVKTTVTQVNE